MFPLVYRMRPNYLPMHSIIGFVTQIWSNCDVDYIFGKLSIRQLKPTKPPNLGSILWQIYGGFCHSHLGWVNISATYGTLWYYFYILLNWLSLFRPTCKLFVSRAHSKTFKYVDSIFGLLQTFSKGLYKTCSWSLWSNILLGLLSPFR